MYSHVNAVHVCWSLSYSVYLFKNSEIGIISGFSGNEEFSDLLIKCGDKNEIICYTECYVGQVILPVEKIVKNYPSVNIIFWDCEGICSYAPIDCNKGKYPTIHGWDVDKTVLVTGKFDVV